MRIVAALLLAAVVAANVGCDSRSASSTAGGPVDDAAALMQASRDWAKAAASRDVEGTLSYWADDAILFQPDVPALVGKPAIRAMVEGGMKDPNFSITWEPERAVISEAGDMGYLIEHNRITFADPTGKTQTIRGKGVTIWKKDANGTWKNVVDIFNRTPTERALPAEGSGG